MKKFYFHRVKQWRSPLEIFPVVQDNNAHLFFSGDAEYFHSSKQENSKNSENLGRYSFIVFSDRKDFEYLGFLDAQKQYIKISEDITQNYQGEEYLQNWKFPFCGGIAGVFSYDFVREIETIEENKNMNSNIPSSFLGLYEQLFAFDHLTQEFFMAGWFERKEDADVFFKKMGERCRTQEKGSCISLHYKKTLEFSGFSPEISEQEYQRKFQICQDEIEKGNSFQINFSQKFLGNTTSDAWDIFLHATKKNPAQMMYFYEHSNTNIAVISCSPERLFSCDRSQNILTQPIAGTRPRGKNSQEEKLLEQELTTSIKELSEHSMIVDLLRNDFGKVSEYGSVIVKKFMRVEKYATVMHLVSDISGKIAPDKNIFEVFESLFPGGTITGTPKTETMKILAREEVSSRNFYCGSAGYFSFCGSADWNILIRTLEKEGNAISGRAGGGLVYGANPKSEYQECLHKFSGLEKIFT